MSTVPSSGSSSGGSAITLFVLGVVCILLWVLATLFQIQTTEAFIGSGQAVNFSPNWGILQQPVALFQSKLNAYQSWLAFMGWGIEIFSQVMIWAYRHARHAVSTHMQHLSPWFFTGIWGILGFNFLTDYLFGNTVFGGWSRLAGSLFMVFVITFSGAIGIKLLEEAFHLWHH